MKNLILLISLLMLATLYVSGQTGHVSDFHKSNEGKIFFTKNSDPDIAKDIEFVEVFGNNDEITACVYIKPDDKGYVKFSGRIVVDGELPGYKIESSKDKYGFALFILSKNFGIESADFSNFVNVEGMKDGDHKVVVEIWDRKDFKPEKTILAQGEFTFKKGSTVVSPTSKFSAIKAGMSDPTLEQQAVNVINTRAKNENWKEKYTKAKIVSTSWEVRKNPVTGKIEDRIIYMKLLGVWPDGKCKVVDFGFRQDYTGGQYSSLKFNSIGEMTPILCD